MPTRVAIIGLGAAAQNIHLPAYAMIKDKITIVGGCDLNEEARDIACRKWGVKDVFSDPDEMIKKTRPDIVSIITQPAQHFENCKMVLERGCHVFCEKPFMDDLVQVDKIIELSDKANRHVVVNNEFRYMQIHSKAKELIGSSRFGELRYFHAWQTFNPTAHTEAGWRGQLEKRVCFEFGNHVFDLIRFFFDMCPTRVFAHMPRPKPDMKADLLNIITVEFSDGRAASFVLDRLCKGVEKYLDIYLDGDNATIHTSIGGEFQLAMGLHTRNRKPFFDFSLVKGGKAELQVGDSSEIIAKDPINPFKAATSLVLSEFVDALNNGTTPPCNAKESRETLALIMAAYESAQSGLPVTL